jgi:hypothetical protein
MGQGVEVARDGLGWQLGVGVQTPKTGYQRLRIAHLPQQLLPLAQCLQVSGG